MEIWEINPFIRYARIHKAFFQGNKAARKCYDCRIFFFNDASGNAYINGKKYNILNKTAIYLPPAAEYRFDVSYGACEDVAVINFDLVNDFKDLKKEFGLVTAESFDPENMLIYSIPKELSEPIVRTIPQIEHLLYECTQNFILCAPLYLESSSSLIRLCLLEFVKYASEGDHSDLCHKVLEYIYKNYESDTLTNQSIAQAFNYHPYHLSRIIKAETGKTLHQYIIYYRLQIAKNLLLTTEDEISTIAWKAGFFSAAYFTKIFRQNTGITPKEYRKKKISI